MIGTGLKKLATEHGLKVAKGVAYGSLMGYATTLSEGAGYKRAVITTKFVDAQKANELLDLVNQKNLKKEYRIEKMEFLDGVIDVVFHDDPGTMKLIYKFIEWFYPLLPEFSATGANYCIQCGEEIVGTGTWKLINGVAYYMHGQCMTQFINQLDVAYEQEKNAGEGYYFTGFAGAAIGSLFGAILWAFVLNFGYVASVVGLVISWLADKGYTLFNGKKGMGKLVILIFVTACAVLLGTIGADVIEMVRLINAGEVTGVTYADIPLWFIALFESDAEYTRYFLSNIAMGLLFACIGCFSFFKRTKFEVGKDKIIALD